MRFALCLLVIASSAACGAQWVRQRGDRLRALEALAAGFTVLRHEIADHGTPMPEALERAAVGEPCGIFFHSIARALSAREELEPAWRAEVEALPYLAREDKMPILELASVLGRYDTSSQLQALERCACSLRDQAHALRPEIRQRAKLTMALSLIVGMILAVTLY